MVGRSYLRYIEAHSGGVVASPACLHMAAYTENLHQSRQGHGKQSRKQQQQSRISIAKTPVVIVAQLEKVAFWNTRSSELVRSLKPEELKPGQKHEVCCVRLSKDVSFRGSLGANSAIAATASEGWIIAIGYANGCVSYFREPMLHADNSQVALPSGVNGGGRGFAAPWVQQFYCLGHKPDTMVSALELSFDSTDAVFMASGGQDTCIVIYDVTSQEAQYRLKGHRGTVVGLIRHIPSEGVEISSEGGVGQQLLISAGADGLIKVWDLTVQQCIHSIVASDTQVTSLAVNPGKGKRLLVGLREREVKVFDIESLHRQNNSNLLGGSSSKLSSAPPAEVEGLIKEDVSADSMPLLGSLPRQTNRAPHSIIFSEDARIVAVVTTQSIELYLALTKEEVKKKAQRKKKRKQTQQQQAGSNEAEQEEVVDTSASARDRLSSEFTPLRIFHIEKKIRAFVFTPRHTREEDPNNNENKSSNLIGREVSFYVTHADNSVVTYSTVLRSDESTGTKRMTATDLKKISVLEHGAHRTDIRQAFFSADDISLVTLSEDCLKRWHVEYENLASVANMTYGLPPSMDEIGMPLRKPVSLTCTSSIEMPDSGATSGCLLPGDQLAVIGFTDGALRIFSFLTGDEHVQEVVEGTLEGPLQAHAGKVVSVVLRPDETGIVSAGQDRKVIYWDFSVEEKKEVAVVKGKKKNHPEKQTAAEGTSSLPSFRLAISVEVELGELPVSVNISQDGKLLAVGLQDYNIQLFYADTLKPFLQLYGHKLPITSVAFTKDGTLCATGGMDKSLRFWGTDFGDCHRAIHAHDDYITNVRFVGTTHYLFSVSLDGSVKHWDGDTWALIQVFRVHQNGLWALAVNADGTCVATAGKDRCIRTFLRTEEILFPEEEEERLAQEAMDEESARRQAMQHLESIEAEVGVAGQQTAKTNEAAENLMEALDRVNVELQHQRDGETGGKKTSHPIFLHKTVWQYLWGVLESIRPSEMRHVLSALTSLHATVLLEYLDQCIDHGVVEDFEKAANVLLALVKPRPGATSAVALYFHEDVGKLSQQFKQSSGDHQLSKSEKILRVKRKREEKVGSKGAAAAAVEAEDEEDEEEINETDQVVPAATRGLILLEKLRVKISNKLREQGERLEFNIAGLSLVRQLLQEKKKMVFFDASKVQGSKRRFARKVN